MSGGVLSEDRTDEREREGEREREIGWVGGC